jgi:hypothetical protein
MSSWAQVLVEQVLELEAPDERVALDAAVGEVAACDARALAVGDPADAPAHERARVQTVGQHLGHFVEGEEAAAVGRHRRIDENADDSAHLGAALPAAVGERGQPGPDHRVAGLERRRATRAQGRRPGAFQEGQSAPWRARSVPVG